jgi:hypothetical protein
VGEGVADHLIQSFIGLLAPVSYSLITQVQEPLEIGRLWCVNTFKLIYISSGQCTLASVEGVSHERERERERERDRERQREREREMRVVGPAAVISLYKYNLVNGTLN